MDKMSASISTTMLRLVVLVLLVVVQTSSKQHSKSGNRMFADHRESSDNVVKMEKINKYGYNRRVAKLNFAEDPVAQAGVVQMGLTGSRGRQGVAGTFIPGNPAGSFVLPTLSGKLRYPGPVLSPGRPVLFHAYTARSAFLQCLWNCSGSLEALVSSSPLDTHYVFVSYQEEAQQDALWMRARFRDVTRDARHANNRVRGAVAGLTDRLHFVTVPVHALGNWLPALLKEWRCSGHNCGLDQAAFHPQGAGGPPLTVSRLDARYDWLPAFPTNHSYDVTYVTDGCTPTAAVKGRVALVTDVACSYFIKVSAMKASGAVGVIVEQTASPCPLDMNCLNQSECATPLNIPLTMVTPLGNVNRSGLVKVVFQNAPFDNFFAAIDGDGLLAEVGWFLYPSFHFLTWQAQWFDYTTRLRDRLSEKALVISVLNHTVMQGSSGASATVNLPPLSELQAFERFELDTALSCPGDLDGACAHWDHTVQLFVCCSPKSPLCGMELGRWITPFRRRIGRWMTDVTALLPLLDGTRCQFTMKTAPWAMTWMPSLSLRFTGTRPAAQPAPYSVLPLYSPGATFDHKYNSHFKTYTFKVPPQATKVEIVSVITGHGSDENGCGEFCVTSHHFAINHRPPFNRTFDIAGSPLGCADRVPAGVEPNEHGTWLYGRDGWCDGQQVSPWVIDVSSSVDRSAVNQLRYFGWFQGHDPNPKQNPGMMIVFSYLVFSKEQRKELSSNRTKLQQI